MKQHLLASIRVYLVLTALLGFVYPFAVWGVGQVALQEKANGSLLRMKERESGGTARGLMAAPTAGPSSAVAAAPAGRVVGSALIGQSFSSRNLFHGRPSAAGANGYDPMSSGGTNLGPTSKKLADEIREAVRSVREENPGASGPVPADAVTSSASGLDPDISPDFARWQVPRVAAATGIPGADLEQMIAGRTEGRFLGLFGEPRVNVLLLNLDLLSRIEARASGR